jgi:hypothetical protein
LPVTLVVLVTKKLAVGPEGAVGVSLSQERAMRARKSRREERVIDVPPEGANDLAWASRAPLSGRISS